MSVNIRILDDTEPSMVSGGYRAGAIVSINPNNCSHDGYQSKRQPCHANHCGAVLRTLILYSLAWYRMSRTPSLLWSRDFGLGERGRSRRTRLRRDRSVISSGELIWPREATGPAFSRPCVSDRQ